MMRPIKFRTGPEMLKLKQKIEKYIKRYVPNSEIQYVYLDEQRFCASTFLPEEGGSYLFTFNERYLEWIPEDEVWKIVNHEIAHVLHHQNTRKRFFATREEAHDPEWQQYARILGTRPDWLRHWDWMKDWGINALAYPRFLLRCKKCGVSFYTSGQTDRYGRFYGEPLSHYLAHGSFLVWDLYLQKRGVVDLQHRVPEDSGTFILKATKFEDEE